MSLTDLNEDCLSECLRILDTRSLTRYALTSRSGHNRAMRHLVQDVTLKHRDQAYAFCQCVLKYNLCPLIIRLSLTDGTSTSHSCTYGVFSDAFAEVIEKAINLMSLSFRRATHRPPEGQKLDWNAAALLTMQSRISETLRARPPTTLYVDGANMEVLQVLEGIQGIENLSLGYDTDKGSVGESQSITLDNIVRPLSHTLRTLSLGLTRIPSYLNLSIPPASDAFFQCPKVRTLTLLGNGRTRTTLPRILRAFPNLTRLALNSPSSILPTGQLPESGFEEDVELPAESIGGSIPGERGPMIESLSADVLILKTYGPHWPCLRFLNLTSGPWIYPSNSFQSCVEALSGCPIEALILTVYHTDKTSFFGKLVDVLPKVRYLELRTKFIMGASLQESMDLLKPDLVDPYSLRNLQYLRVHLTSSVPRHANIGVGRLTSRGPSRLFADTILFRDTRLFMDTIRHRADAQRQEQALASLFSQSWFRDTAGTDSDLATPTGSRKFPSLKCVEVSGLYTANPFPQSSYWGISTMTATRDGAEGSGGSKSPLDEMMEKEEAEMLKEPYLKEFLGLHLASFNRV